MGSVFGDIFRVATFGESHGAAIGCIIDGCPAGLRLLAEDIGTDMRRRRPGHAPFTSPRREDDEVAILSGIFENKTTGAPIGLVVYNCGQNSAEYQHLERIFRPGHADYTYFSKYGIRDHRGGGRASGRETAARVAAGAVAKLILAQLGVDVSAEVAAIGDVEQCLKDGDSTGSRAICRIGGLKPGIGRPVFDKLNADLAKAIFSIGGVVGLEFGAGFAAADSRGSLNNDEFCKRNGKIAKASNNSGGMLGGISDGDEIYFQVAFKPPSSIAKAQRTVDIDGNEVEIAINGRHDPAIAPRACVVIEAMAAIVLVNHIFSSLADTMGGVKKAYCRRMT